ISFHSDEAIVALMARHILQGEMPTFFYGQHYMGSLNAFGTAGAFALFGDQVAAIRGVQFITYLAVTASSYAVAWHLSHDRIVALAGGLTLAIPAPIIVIYTATNIGSYAETMLIGNLLLILGYDVARAHPYDLRRWIALGLLTGLGWWAHGLIIAYALPVALFAMWSLVRVVEDRARYARLIVVGLFTFFIGGAPWWLYNFANGWAAAGVYLSFGSDSGGLESSLFERFIGLVLLGIPAVVGMRYTWLAYFAIPVGIIVIGLVLVAGWRLARAETPPLRDSARFLVLGVPLGLIAVFLASSFGADPTGRYLLPLIVPFAMWVGVLASDWHAQEWSGKRRWLWLLPIVIVSGYHAAGVTIAALRNDPGFTTQFNLETHTSNTYDAEVIEWLRANNLQHGYTNYWIGYRLAFLSAEDLQYATSLSYRADEIAGNIVERYPAYALATEANERNAYVSWDNLPDQNERLQSAFDAQDITYQTHEIGPFNIYHDFTRDGSSYRPPQPIQLEEWLE
ncbi:MAG: hypothetical protein AAF125_17055, partial [Chloroflexota bacterium]